MQPDFINGKRGYYFLFTVLFFLLFFNLGKTPLYILDEVKNAQCAREMLERHDWIIPSFNDKLRTDKPPLHYFFMMLAYSLLGINAFAARFFSAICGVATVFITWQFAKKYLQLPSAFFAGLVLVCSTHFLFEFRLSVPDPYLIFFTTASLFSGFIWLNDGKIKFLYLAAIAAAFAMLSKGPVGVALPAACLLTWIIWKRKWKTAFSWHLLSACIVFFVLAAPWFAAVHRATNGVWVRGFFLEHNVKRFLEPMEGHGGLFLLVPLFFLIGLLPFGVYAAEIFRKRKTIFNHPALQFAALVVIVFLIVFSFSGTKLPNYIMPSYPFAAIILGSYFHLIWKQNTNQVLYPFFILLLIAMILPVAGYFGIQKEILTADLAWMALLLISVPIIMLTLFFFQNNKTTGLFKIISITWLALNFLGLQVIYPSLFQRNPVSQTIAMVKQSPAVYGYTIINPAYLFYMPKRIPVTDNADTLQKWLSNTEEAIVITRTGFEDQLKNIPLEKVEEKHNLFESSTTVIYQYRW